MTDFLIRLSQRALGLAPVVQPLVASVFEPAQAVAADTFPFDIEQEYVAENEEEQRPSSRGTEVVSAPPSSYGRDLYGRDLSRPPTPQEHRPATMQAGRAHTNPRTDARHSQMTPLYETSGSQSTSPLRSLAGEVQRSMQKTSAKDTQSEYQATRPSMVQERNGSDSADRLPPSIGPQNVPETRAHGNHSNPLQSNTEAPHIAVFASTETPTSTPTTPAQSRVLHPLVTARGKTSVGAARSAQQFIAPSRLDAPPLTHQPDVVLESPTIQVTIGRVEVRATPLPPTAKTQQQQHSTSSKMSLDEYLKQRSRGGK